MPKKRRKLDPNMEKQIEAAKKKGRVDYRQN